GGFAIALPLAVQGAGGWNGVSAVHGDATYWNFWQSGPSGWMYIFLLGPAFIVSPGLLQKIYGARDDRAVRLGVGMNALGLLLYAAVPPMLGIVARAHFPDLPQHELALPMVLMHGVPPLVGSLGLAAVFSAEISAADARVLAVTRGAAVVCGGIAIALAIVSPTIIGVIGVFYGLLGVSLFVPILAGLYVGRAGTPEALASIAAGVATMAALQLATGGRGVAGMTPALAGLTAAAIGFVVVFISRLRTHEPERVV